MIKAEKVVLLANNDEILTKVYVNLLTKSDIEAIVSETLSGDIFGCPIYHFNWLEKQEITDFLLIIADNKEMLYFVRKLRGMKLELIDNWVPHWLINTNEIDPIILYEFVGKDTIRFEKAMLALKKHGRIIAIHGNCQTVAIRYYLKFVKEFADNFFVFIMPQFWNNGEIEKYEKLYKSGALSYVDILVTQNIAKNNRFGEIISTERVLMEVTNGCSILKICNCYLDAYYPQYMKTSIVDDERKININTEALQMFKNKLDYNVLRLLEEGKSVDEVLDYICDEKLYSKKFIFNRFWDELSSTKLREKECDIKICDFIEENVDKDLLFEANMHPTERVFSELCKRLLLQLGIKCENIYTDGGVHAVGLPGDERIPIYPAVIKQLGLNRKYNCLLYKLPTGKKVTFREYMVAYIQAVFPSVNKGD
ncbi:MAG: WcbI family polysaccharide biosynthesis putative acetyltransferase [Lachnospiraceae bacterium]